MAETTRSDRKPEPPRTGALPQPGSYGFKRLVLGPALPTAQLIHERLGRSTALAIFSSDALSSVAYATEEMLRTLFIAGAVATAAFALIVPLSFVIVGVLAVLMFSYRQTIKAYPSAGGAYIVTKDNFGLIPAQVAGVALLTDYVLTVAVSVSAGVAAIIAAVPSLNELRVPMCVFFIALIAVGNLRGVKESGRIFAAPTFLFLTMIGSLIVIGLVRLASGSLHHAAAAHYVAGWASEHAARAVEPLAVVGLFLGLHALASGSTAMTGVEAISNGVPAFRAPEWKNARTTLMWMGGLLGTMFLGISFLAQRVQAVPDPTQKQTVLAEIGRAVYGTSTFGHVGFYVLQIATTMVLVLAANTAFADFPRLASFQAGDDFLPRQFTTRGHRLVFSNGIIALSASAAALVIAFGGDVTRLIPFYAIGVFTSFTLSQAGMAKRHLRLREPHWRIGLLINGLGAAATGVVLIVIGITKFVHGAWAVIVLVPIMVVALVRLARQYEREQAELERDLSRFEVDSLRRPTMVLLVAQVDRKTIHALQYAKTVRADDILAVHIEEDRLRTLELETAWRAAGLGGIPLKVLRGGGEMGGRLAGFVGGLPTDRDVNILIPVPHDLSRRERLSELRLEARLTRALLPYEQVRVTLVRDHPEGVHPLAIDAASGHVVRMAPRGTHVAIVPVDKLDSAVLRAVRYPLTLGCTEVWAVHAAVDPERAAALVKRWMEAKMPVPLDVIECWDRNVARALEGYVLSRAGRGTEVTVVMARRDFPKVRQRILHDRTSNKIMRALGRYPHVDITRVPYYLDAGTAPEARVASAAGVQ